MSIHQSLSRLKGKLKKGLQIGSRDVSPTLSSPNLPANALSTTPGSTTPPAPGRKVLFTDASPEINDRPSVSTPQVDIHPGEGGNTSHGSQTHTSSGTRNLASSRTLNILPGSQLTSVAPPLVVLNASSNTAGLDTDHQPSGDNEQQTDEQPSRANVVSTGAKLLLRVINENAEFFSPLKSAIGGLSECFDIYERINSGRRDYGKTVDAICELLKELQGHMRHGGEIEMTNSVKGVCCQLYEEVKNLKENIQGPTVRHWLKAVDAPSEIAECHGRIQRLLERLTLNATVYILKNLKRQNEIIDKQEMGRRLDRMLPARSSVYNSAESDEIRRSGCTQGTRASEITSLLEWARTPTTGKTCWMNGMAGTGKTTIAYTVCTTLEEESALGATFFCSRAIPECRQVKQIIPTIAYQLARYSLPFRFALDKILESDPDSHTRALKIQYQKLIVEPLSTVRASLPSNLIVVIDALDECENESSVGMILDLLSSPEFTLPIRFLVSSRPEPEIHERLANNARLVLHELDSSSVSADIETYMRRELMGIPLTDAQWTALLKRCGVLFIFAATTCRFIKQEHKMHALEEAVDIIINSDSVRTGGGGINDIDALYTSILGAAFQDSRMSNENRKKMWNILETVICAQEPMTVDILAQILRLKSIEQAQALLQPLRSVLNVTPATSHVVTLHASFPDFMLSPARSVELRCAAKTRHAALAGACLHIIETVKPRFNFCGISSSYLPDDEVEDLSVLVEKAISPGLTYACRYWATHLCLGEYEVQLVEVVRRFFSGSLLLWMEVLNVTKNMRFGPSIIQKAGRWCSERAVPNDITRIAHDAQQFVSVYVTNPVCQSTPHIYLSMLPFWPKSRPISMTYMPRAIGMLHLRGTALDRRQTSLLATWRVSSRAVVSISLSTDGAQIVAAAENSIDILDTSTGEGILHIQEPQTEGARTVAISPDGTRIAFGSPSGAYILDVKTGEITKLCPEQITEVLCVVFSLDGSLIAMGSESGNVFIYATQQAELVFGPIRAHTGRVNSVVFSHDGGHFASGSADKTISVWDTKGGRMVGSPLTGHTDAVWWVSYSPDGSRLASASGDKTIRVWDLQAGQTILGPLESHCEEVYSVTFSPNGAFISSGSQDKTIRVYDAHTGQTVLGPLQGHTDWIESAIFSPDGSQLFSCSNDGTIRLWNVQDRHVPTASHPDVPNQLRSVQYSPDGSRVVSGSEDGTVHVWNVQTGEMVLGPLKGHSEPISAVGFSSDGAYIASASLDSTLRIWSAKDGKDIHGPMQGHTENVNCVRFSPDSSLVVSGSSDRTMRVWDVATGQLVAEPLRGHSYSVRSVAFSPNGSHVVSGSSDRTIRVWDIQTGQPVIGPLQGHEDWVRLVEFSPDGTQILSGSDDRSLRTWDALTGQLLLVFGKDRNYINSAAFSPDGHLVVSGSDDRTVCVWDAQSGDLILTLEGHTNLVLGVQFSPDGSHVVSCSSDGTIRFWDLSNCRARVGDRSTKADDGEEDDAGRVGAASQPWTLRDDGWVVDRQGRRLVWVPSDLQRSVICMPNDFMIAKAGYLSLNFRDANVGNGWIECNQP